jgi:hypothetical protein
MDVQGEMTAVSFVTRMSDATAGVELSGTPVWRFAYAGYRSSDLKTKTPAALGDRGF